MSRIIISIVPGSGDSYSIDANDGNSSLRVNCKEDLIFWNLFKIKIKFTLNSLFK